MKNVIAMLLLAAATSLVGCRDIFEKDISRYSVSVIAPVDGVETIPGTITFLWRTVPYAEGYQLTVVSPSFAKAAQVLSDTLVAGTTFNLELAAGQYQWSMQPWNFGYNGVRKVYTLRVVEPEIEQEVEDEPKEDTE